MQITAHDDRRLVIHQGPWGLRFMGLIFAVMGGGVVWIVWGQRGAHNAWVGLVVGGIFALVGVAMLLLAGDVLCIFDKSTRSTTIQRRGLFSANTSIYAWSDIQDVALERSVVRTGDHGRTSTVFRPVFVMKNGAHAPWLSVSTGNLGPQLNCVAAARSFGGWHALPDEQLATDADAARRAAAAARTGRLLAIPFLAIFAIVGSLLYIQQVRHYLTWQPTPARITSVRVDEVRGDKGTTYRPAISYVYQRAGATLAASGATILNVSSSYRWADGIRRRYRVGDSVTAYIDPTNTARGFVVRELSWFPLVFVAAPLLMAPLLLTATGQAQRGLKLAAAEHVPFVTPAGNGGAAGNGE